MKTLLLIYFFTAISAFTAELNFSSMENGDRVEITHHSFGCFHNIISYYEVRKTGDIAYFTQYAITWDKSVPAKMIEKKVIGELQLTRSDITGLDSLLGYFRGEKDSGSTTQVFVQLEYYEGATLIRTENVWDASGGRAMRNRPDVISFHALTERFHQSTNRPSAKAQ